MEVAIDIVIMYVFCAIDIFTLFYKLGQTYTVLGSF